MATTAQRQSQAQRSSPAPAPRSLLQRARRQIWRQWINIEGSFAAAMLEPWEKVLLVTVFLSLTFLLWWSIYYHFPRHARAVARRAAYYFWGTLDSAASAGVIASPSSSSTNTNAVSAAAADALVKASLAAAAPMEKLAYGKVLGGGEL